MQVHADEANQLFAKQILDVFYHFCFYNTIKLPPQITNCYYHVEKLCEFVFPQTDLYYFFNNLDFFQSKAILSQQNNTIANFNYYIFQDFLGKEQIFELVNQADHDWRNGTKNNAHKIPIKFFQLINVTSLFFLQLCLKISILIILKQNLHDKNSFCNNIRLIVTRLHWYCIGT